MSAPLAVVIPARNEGQRLPSLLADLAEGSSLVREICVVDGTSADATATVARLGGARVLWVSPNRGLQLQQGVGATSAPWLLLLHADGRLPRGWQSSVAQALDQGTRCCWAFHLGIQGRGLGLRVLERLVTWRTAFFQEPYGDQGLLVHRQTLARVGGIAPIPLMEDLDLVERLRAQGPIRMLAGRYQVDGRRWQELGLLRTSWANAQLRRAWRQGEDPHRLAERYGAYQKAQRRCWGSSSQPWLL